MDHVRTALPPRRGSPKEYPLCFGAKVRKIGIPLQTPVSYINVGYKGVYISWTCYADDKVFWCLIMIHVFYTDIF